jgi:hypothetical protein
MPHPPSQWRRKVGANKGLRTISKEGIAIANFTKKPHPSSQLERMGGTINYNK